MALERKDAIKATVSVVALLASGLLLFVMFGPEGCGPSEEEQRILDTLNTMDALIQKGGYVKEAAIDYEEDRGPGVYRYDAEIVDKDGVAIGRLRGGRVEGFGTMKPRIKWYETPGVPEDWPSRRRR